MLLVAIFCILGCVGLFVFAYLMDRRHGATLGVVLIVWIWNMQPITYTVTK